MPIVACVHISMISLRLLLLAYIDVIGGRTIESWGLLDELDVLLAERAERKKTARLQEQQQQTKRLPRSALDGLTRDF